MLGEIARRCRRVLEAGFALTFEGQVTDQLSGQAGDEVDVAGIDRILAGGVDGHVEPGLSADLGGTGVDDMRGG